VTTAGGQALPIVGQGTAQISKNKDLYPILYVPGMKRNLLSVSKLADDGNYTLFGPTHCWVFDKDNPANIILRGTRSQGTGLYRLHSPDNHRPLSSLSNELPVNLASTPNITKSELWHQRLAHLNYQYLYNLSQQQMVKGLPPLPQLQHSYEACLLGKQHRNPFPSASSTPTSRPLELIHSDLCGPLPQKSLTGSRYILTFTYDYSHYSWVYFLSAKSETFDTFKKFQRMVENQSHQKLSCLRTDRGGEYLSNEFMAYCKLHGIMRQLTTARTPQQNGIVERKNCHLLETMRSLLFGAKLPTYLWEEAARTANYISNRVPTRALYRITPHQRYTKQKPDISHLRLFGSASYLHIQTRSKIEPRSKPMVLVGYDETSKAYRCFDPTRKKIVISKDVLFNENIIGVPNPIASSSQDDDTFQMFLRSHINYPRL
jgi:hypothetical protein